MRVGSYTTEQQDNGGRCPAGEEPLAINGGKAPPRGGPALVEFFSVIAQAMTTAIVEHEIFFEVRQDREQLAIRFKFSGWKHGRSHFVKTSISLRAKYAFG